MEDASAGAAMSLAVPDPLKAAEEEILEAIADENLRKLFLGRRLPLDENETALIDAKFEEDKRILEVINAMTPFELSACLAMYEPANPGHYAAMERIDWLKPEFYFLGKKLRREPSYREKLKDMEERKIDKRFHAYYILTYHSDKELILSRDGSALKPLDWLLDGRRSPLERDDLMLLDDKRNRDRRVIQRIKGMVKEDFDETDKYKERRENSDHYANIQGVDWLRPEIYFLGKALGHEPDWREQVKDINDKNTGPRFRAYYVFSYSYLVERVG